MDYVTRLRRELHKIPEIGFELPKTIAFVKSELDKIGVEYTEKYGISSIVATVNPEKSHFTIGIRADMDALPMQEANEVDYKSTIDGQMHACGHDAHTAIALATVKRLYEMRDKISCRVKVLFQANEEISCGAKNMVQDGVMEDIDCIIALHCGAESEVGKIRLCSGEQNAVSTSFSLRFQGKSAHVAEQAKGVDAIMMAVSAYTQLQFMISKEIPAKEKVIFNVGKFNGGTAKNIIADECVLLCTLRTHTEARAQKTIARIKQIIRCCAESAGGSASYEEIAYYPIVVNDENVTEKVRQSAIKVLGAENVLPRQRGMGGEDFAYFAQIKPACIFRLGVGNKEKGIVSNVHTVTFNIDERALHIGVELFTQFVLDNMHGV